MSTTHSTYLPLIYGEFKISHHSLGNEFCISLSYGDLKKVPVVRLHSSCLFGESFHAQDCDCAQQLESSIAAIKENGSGVVIYSYSEGRGIGIENKIKALELQRTKKINTVEAFRELGFSVDERSYDKEIEALNDLNINKNIKLATQNPNKIKAIKNAGYSILEYVDLKIIVNEFNKPELETKKNLMGYSIDKL